MVQKWQNFQKMFKTKFWGHKELAGNCPRIPCGYDPNFSHTSHFPIATWTDGAMHEQAYFHGYLQMYGEKIEA